MKFANPFKKKNIKHPKFTEGELAFHNGIELSDNPYAVDTEFFSKWESGWKAAAQARRTFEEKGKTKKALSHSQTNDSDSNLYKITEFIETTFKIIVGVFFVLLIVGGILYALYWLGKALLGFIKYYSQFA